MKDNIVFDPSSDEVLGVFDNDVYVKTYLLLEDDSTEEIMLIMSRKEYLRVWKNWLDGKKMYCEKWNEFCGVMGYSFPEVSEEVNSMYGIEGMKSFRVDKFGKPDFEHG